MTNKTFATVINCIDGRVQEPVTKWVKENFGVDYVDTITEPGDDKTLSHIDLDIIKTIRSKVEISVNAHGSKHLFIAGHYDCAANPVDKNEHIIEIKRSVETAKSWGLSIEVIGLWVNDEWKVEQVA